MGVLKVFTMSNSKKTFPIQGGDFIRGEGHTCRTEIPWWLAEVAYEHFSEKWPGITLERLAERGGFGRDELVGLIRREL